MYHNKLNPSPTWLMLIGPHGSWRIISKSHLLRNGEEIICTFAPNRTHRRRWRWRRRRRTKRRRHVKARWGNRRLIKRSWSTRLAAVTCGQTSLQLPLSTARPRATVLKPVEDVGIANCAKLLKKLSDSDCFLSGRVNHATVEDGFKYEDLFGFRCPSWSDGIGDGGAACRQVTGTGDNGIGGVILWLVMVHGWVFVSWRRRRGREEERRIECWSQKRGEDMST